MSTCVAFIRGINVGKANRVAMSDLRDLVAGLGHANVSTLLNSGNVLFQSKSSGVLKIAAGIEAAIAAQCGFSAAVTVISVQELDRIVHENPLLHAVNDHARHLIAFAQPKHLDVLRSLVEETWTPDAFAVTKRAAYLWCSAGILDSKLLKAFSRAAGATATTRNWATVLKLQAAAAKRT